MSVKDQILVVVPARGGSKRLPKKNIRKINNKPMISWMLKELVKFISKKQILISTDDKNIVNLVKKMDFSVPFLRPAKISGDKTTTLEVAKHALNWYESNIKKMAYTLIIYPTSIFLKKRDLDNAFNEIKKNQKCTSLFAASKYSHPIERAFNLNKNKLNLLYPKNFSKRTQDFNTFFHDVGQFYFCRSEIIRKQIPIINNNSRFVVFPKYKAIDIDDQDDFRLAEIFLKYYKY